MLRKHKCLFLNLKFWFDAGKVTSSIKRESGDLNFQKFLSCSRNCKLSSVTGMPVVTLHTTVAKRWEGKQQGREPGDLPEALLI